MKYVVLHGNYARYIDAESIEEAALEAARYTSVWDGVIGEELRVFPADFAQIVRVQYERPRAWGEMDRLADYGRLRVVDEFIPTPERKSGLFR